jgi:phage gp36-like protein
MSEFIEMTDYDATIHQEILNAVTREDDAIVEVCEDQAIAEMRGYLESRYDCDKIFAARGNERNALILMFAKDITIYHVMCVHNPQKFAEIRKDRYERAIEWLKGVSRLEISIADVPLLDKDTLKEKMPFQMRSNPKRVTHY